MATPGELVRVMAELLGVPEATVVQHDRNLLLAGKRTKGGRGRSAAKVTVTDAANLLIPVASGSLIKETLKTWKKYAPMLPWDPRPPESFQLKGLTAWDIDIPSLRALPAQHSFVEALVALISAARDGELGALREKGVGSPAPFEQPPIRVSISGPFPQASVEIDTVNRSERRTYMQPHRGGILELHKRAKRTFARGDLSFAYFFTDQTVLKLGELFRSGKDAADV